MCDRCRWDPIDTTVFFRHDGTIPMSGDLDMAGFDILACHTLTVDTIIGGSPVHIRTQADFGENDEGTIGLTTVNIEGDDEDALALILNDEDLPFLALKSATAIAIQAPGGVVFTSVEEGVNTHARQILWTTPDADGDKLNADDEGVHWGGHGGELDPYVFEVLNSQDLAALHIDQVNSITTFYGDITFNSIAQAAFFPNGGTHVIGTFDVTGETTFLDKATFTNAGNFIDSFESFDLDVVGIQSINFRVKVVGESEVAVLEIIDNFVKPSTTNKMSLGSIGDKLFKDIAQTGTHYFGDSSTGITPLGGGLLSIFAGSGIILGNDVLIEGTADVEGLLAGFAGAKLGDGGITDYTEFGVDGFITLHGESRVTNKLSVLATGAGAGVSTPTLTTRAVGASGDVLLDVLRFSKVTQNDSRVNFCASDTTDDSVNGYFVLRWLPGVAWTSGNYVWVLEYLVKSQDEDITTGTPTTISMDVTPANAVDQIVTVFGNSIDLNDGQSIVGHFYRNVGSDNGDDAGDVVRFQFEYTANKLGKSIAA